MDRNAFLERVRQAAQRGRTYRVHLDDVPDDVGYVGAGTDKCAALAAEVNAVGGEAVVFDHPDEVAGALDQLLNQYKPDSALLWQHPLLDQLEVGGLLDAAGVPWFDYARLNELDADAQRQAMLAAGVGISSVNFAVGETGTLAVCSEPGRERVVSLLPPVHIAIVAATQIVSDLFDVFRELASVAFDDLPSNLAFITGPSKTGDIELQLTTGVHGPGNWHVLILRDATGSP